MATSNPAPGDREAYLARKKAFLEHSAELRALTAGREHTPAEELIREARDRGYDRLRLLD